MLQKYQVKHNDKPSSIRIENINSLSKKMGDGRTVRKIELILSLRVDSAQLKPALMDDRFGQVPRLHHL
jgi:hypothetical protein